jgi:hypothetical protein
MGAEAHRHRFHVIGSILEKAPPTTTSLRGCPLLTMPFMEPAHESLPVGTPMQVCPQEPSRALRSARANSAPGARAHLGDGDGERQAERDLENVPDAVAMLVPRVPVLSKSAAKFCSSRSYAADAASNLRQINGPSGHPSPPVIPAEACMQSMRTRRAGTLR